MTTLLQPPFLWFYACAAFLFLELLAPGFVAIFFAFGCLAASLAAWLLGVDLTWQVTIFSVMTVVSLLSLRRFFLATFSGRQTMEGGDDYDQQQVGKAVLVTKEIRPKLSGEVKLGGSYWTAVSDHTMAEGDSGTVVAVDVNNPLIVKVAPNRVEDE